MQEELRRLLGKFVCLQQVTKTTFLNVCGELKFSPGDSFGWYVLSKDSCIWFHETTVSKVDAGANILITLKGS